ncbi:MAG: serine/threonine protein phosphatase, partial [Selenomonadaceae bacterium]|nr:serine/threonine protein phosphatase [Selenomonadaceae bacterium]
MEKFFVYGAEEIIPPVNDSPYKRIIAVGDIHGKFKRFMSLLKKLYVTDEDLIIFLGDYVDRGEGVAEVLERVISHKKNFIFLRGNHEQMMLDAFRDDRDFLEEIFSGKKKILTNRDVLEHNSTTLWVINGGQQTLAGIIALQRKKFLTIDELMKFVEDLPLSHTLEIGG